MLHEDVGANLFITFHTSHDDERIVAEEIGTAMGCKAVTLKEVLSKTHEFPSTQTRVAFHGHGGSDTFGSQDHNLSPDEFADEIITLLNRYPNIKDIDLLSCNLGLLDEDGNCYASIVQSRLDKAGFAHVNVNTFLVDNGKKNILDSFFIVGMSESPQKGYLSKGTFSLDLLRVENEEQVLLHEQINRLNEQLYELKVKGDVLRSISGVCSGDDVTMEKFKKEMTSRGYNEKQLTSIIRDFNVVIHDSDESDNYFTCNIVDSSKKYIYKRDARTDLDTLDEPERLLRDQLLRANNDFALLRSTQKNTRVFTGEIRYVQDYLVPARQVTEYQLRTQIMNLTKLDGTTDIKAIGKSLKSIAQAYKLNESVNLLDVYTENLAQVFLTYKSTNVERLSALQALAIEIGKAYVNILVKNMDVTESIDLLKEQTTRICDIIRKDHKEKGTMSFPNFPGGGLMFTQSSLARTISQAIAKSETVVKTKVETVGLKL